MQQLNFDGRTKEDLAIEFIRKYEPPEGYFLGVSGGKDSTVLYDLTKKSGVRFQAYYSATGIDAPEVVKFIRKEYPDVIHCKPKESFFALIPKVGYPNKWSRWCCDYLKKYPTKHIPLKHRLMGIRAEESSRRAARPIISYFKELKQTIYKPIFNWLEWEVWQYIEDHNIPYCSLYDEGFDRLGCVVCPFLTPRKHEMNRARWPKHYYAFERAMRKWWDMKIEKGKTPRWKESTFEEFLSNWYAGK